MTKRKVLLSFLCLLISAGVASAQNKNVHSDDTADIPVDTLLLDEIVVTPKVLNTFGNKERIELNADARKIGNNALDAIGSLPQFKSMSVGLEYVHNPYPTKVFADIKGFSYSEETVWNNFRNLVSVKFTYYFYKGKSRGHEGKRISNADNDSGLMQYNTAK